MKSKTDMRLESRLRHLSRPAILRLAIPFLALWLLVGGSPLTQGQPAEGGEPADAQLVEIQEQDALTESRESDEAAMPGPTEPAVPSSLPAVSEGGSPVVAPNTGPAGQRTRATPTPREATPTPTPRTAGRRPSIRSVPAASAVGACTSPRASVDQVSYASDEVIAWQAQGFRPRTSVQAQIFGPIPLGSLTGPAASPLVSAIVDDDCRVVRQPDLRLDRGVGSGTYELIVTGTTYRTEEELVLSASFSVGANQARPRSIGLAEPRSQDPPAASISVPNPAPIPAPSSFQAVAVNHNTIRLSWSDRSGDETGFEVGSPVGTFQTAPNATSLTVGGLRPDARHCFTLTAINEAGASRGVTTCASTPSPP